MSVSQYEVVELAKLLRTYRCSQFPLRRIGSDRDGGYVINEPKFPMQSVISLGIDQEVSFDLFFAERGIKVYQYDPTIAAPPILNSNFIFTRKAVSHLNSEKTITIEQIIKDSGLNDTNSILKFDIEGHEWGALAGTSSTSLSIFQTIVGEFHFLDALTNKDNFALFFHVFQKLHHTHIVTHLHPNNGLGVVVVQGVILPRLVELTWRRRDIGCFSPDLNGGSSNLDFPCSPSNPELLFPSFWYL